MRRATTSRSVATTVALVLGLALTLSACGRSSEGAVPEPTASSDLVADARAGGAGADQLAVLADGAVSYDEYETAMNAAFACLRAEGFQVDVLGTTSRNGVTVLDYQMSGATTGTDLAAGDAARGLVQDCYVREAKYVDQWWQVTSPDAIAYSDRRDAALGPLLRQCLVRHGSDQPDDASMIDLIRAAGDLLVEDSSADCLGEIGYFEWAG